MFNVTAILRRRGSKFVLSITAYLLYLAFMLVEDPLAARDKNPLSHRKEKTFLTFQMILAPSLINFLTTITRFMPSVPNAIVIAFISPQSCTDP